MSSIVYSLRVGRFVSIKFGFKFLNGFYQYRYHAVIRHRSGQRLAGNSERMANGTTVASSSTPLKKTPSDRSSAAAAKNVWLLTSGKSCQRECSRFLITLAVNSAALLTASWRFALMSTQTTHLTTSEHLGRLCRACATAGITGNAGCGLQRSSSGEATTHSPRKRGHFLGG